MQRYQSENFHIKIFKRAIYYAIALIETTRVIKLQVCTQRAAPQTK